MTTILPAFQMPAAPAVATAPTPPALRVDDAAEKYRALRDKKKAIQEKHKLELKPYNDLMEQLEALLLDALNKTGSNSMRTLEGTVYRSVRTTYTVSDPVAFREWVEANNHFEFFENRASKEAIEAHVAGGGALPPGIKVSSDTTVNIRK